MGSEKEIMLFFSFGRREDSQERVFSFFFPQILVHIFLLGFTEKQVVQSKNCIQKVSFVDHESGMLCRMEKKKIMSLSRDLFYTLLSCSW